MRAWLAHASPPSPSTRAAMESHITPVAVNPRRDGIAHHPRLRQPAPRWDRTSPEDIREPASASCPPRDPRAPRGRCQQSPCHQPCRTVSGHSDHSAPLKLLRFGVFDSREVQLRSNRTSGVGVALRCRAEPSTCYQRRAASPISEWGCQSSWRNSWITARSGMLHWPYTEFAKGLPPILRMEARCAHLLSPYVALQIGRWEQCWQPLPLLSGRGSVRRPDVSSASG